MGAGTHLPVDSLSVQPLVARRRKERERRQGQRRAGRENHVKEGRKELGSGLLCKGLGVERKLVSSELSSWPSLVTALVSGSN